MIREKLNKIKKLTDKLNNQIESLRWDIEINNSRIRGIQNTIDKLKNV